MKDEPRDPRANQAPEQRVGRFLGKAVGKLKGLKTWKEMEKAYREGREGKD